MGLWLAVISFDQLRVRLNVVNHSCYAAHDNFCFPATPSFPFFVYCQVRLYCSALSAGIHRTATCPISTHLHSSALIEPQEVVPKRQKTQAAIEDQVEMKSFTTQAEELDFYYKKYVEPADLKQKEDEEKRKALEA
jgi:hypothetical protein